MPPKQVYGRRAKIVTNYTKFLTPDKVEGVEETGKKKTSVKTTNEHKADIGEVEKQLEALKISSHDVHTVRSESEEGRSSGEAGCKVPIDLAESRQSKSPQQPAHTRTREEEKLCDQSTKKKSGRSRRALGSRDTNAEAKEKRRAKKKEKQPVCSSEHENISTSDASKTSHAQVNAIGTRLSVKVSADLRAPSTPRPYERANARREIKEQPGSPPKCEENLYTAYVRPLLKRSDRSEIISFEAWSSRLEPVVDVAKIAEASFSEVYRLSLKSGQLDRANESVLKLVALKAPPDEPLPSERNGNERTRRKGDTAQQLQTEREERIQQDTWKSPVDDVLSEVRLLQNLNHIPGFTNFRELTILQGRPSATFGKAWKDWNKLRPKGKKSEFPDPTKKTSYDENQLWAVIEMQDAGTDCGKVMEAGGITTIWEIWDVFWNVCLSVAKAEEACRFEHRDLHMDNICIRSSTTDTCLTQRTIQNPLKRKLGFSSLETTVIDYTLSRADIINAATSRRTSLLCSPLRSSVSLPSNNSVPADQEVAYLDLNKDQSLFEGDASEEYQYEIYRYMRGAAFYGIPLQSPSMGEPSPTDETPVTPRRSPRKLNSVARRLGPEKDVWKAFHPKTNLVWVHFVLYRLLENLHYAGNEPASKSNAIIMQGIEGVDMENSSKVWKKAVKMHKILQKVAERLDPEALGRAGSLSSCTELVVLALEVKWLGIDDVVES